MSSGPGTYRIVVCIDIDADSTEDAYGKVYTAMGLLERENEDIEWESSDEWYGPEGNPIPEEDVQAACMAFLGSEIDV